MIILERKIDDLASMALFLFFFCDGLFASILYRLVGSGLLAVAYNCIFFILVLLSCLFSRAKRLVPNLVFYALVFVLIFATMTSHPEYNSWFFGDRYGLSTVFLNPRGAIWAFLVISLVGDRKKMYECLKVAAWLLLAYQAIRYATAYMQGYWEEIDYLGNPVQQSYSLTFGYDTLLPVAIFGARAFLERKKLCYIPFALGLMLILLGGSRGAFVFVPAVFLIMLPFRWKEMGVRSRITLIGASIALVAFFLSGLPLSIITNVSNSLGIESRTIESIVNGTLDNSNGRDVIYQTAIGLIHNGGAFGHGVYGDRTTLSSLNIWGYSHNIFLELYVSFGYMGGTLLVSLLLVGIIRTYRRCETVCDKILFCVLLGCSLKLLISDSFWYYPPFWALLALMVMWRVQSAKPHDALEETEVPEADPARFTIGSTQKTAER